MQGLIYSWDRGFKGDGEKGFSLNCLPCIVHVRGGNARVSRVVLSKKISEMTQGGGGVRCPTALSQKVGKRI